MTTRVTHTRTVIDTKTVTHTRTVSLLGICICLGFYALLMLAAQASAADQNENNASDEYSPHFYLGAGIGLSKIEPQPTGNSNFFVSDDSSQGYNVVLGYHWKPRWAFDLTFSDLGDAEMSRFLPGNLTERVGEIGYQNLALSGNYFFREPEAKLNYFAKLGVNEVFVNRSNDTLPITEVDSLQWNAGLGALYYFHPSWAVRTVLDVFSEDAMLASVGLHYRKQPKSEPVDPCENNACEPLVPKLPVMDFDKVLFAFDRSNLNAAGKEVVEDLVTYLQAYPELRVQLEGHTDSLGSNAYNDALAERRIATVKQALLDAGIPADRLVDEGYGELRPALANTSIENRAQNRRVEFQIIYPE